MMSIEEEKVKNMNISENFFFILYWYWIRLESSYKNLFISYRAIDLTERSIKYIEKVLIETTE